MIRLETDTSDLKEKETAFEELKESLDYVLTQRKEAGLLQGILKISEITGTYEHEAILIIVQKVNAILDNKSEIPKPSLRAISETLEKFITNRNNTKFTNDDAYLQAKTTLTKISQLKNKGFWSIFKSADR